MEYNDTIMSSYASMRGGRALTLRAGRTYASTRDLIRVLTDTAWINGDGQVKVTWTVFADRGGRMVEKCAIEWTLSGVRMTDVVWIKRSYRWV